MLHKHQNPELGYSEKLNNVIVEIQEGIRNGADDYYKAGIDLYRNYTKELEDGSHKRHNVQVIVGNLCISIELMLKAVIAKETFIFIYSGLSDELAMALTYPDKVTTTYNFVNELSTFKKPKSIEFNEAVSRFYKIFPEQKALFDTFLSNISDIRNNSVHAYLPKYNKHQLERIVFTAIKLHRFLNEKKYFEFDIDNSGRSRFEYQFLKDFEQESGNSFEKKIKEAKEKSKKTMLSNIEIAVSNTDWNRFVTPCPICQSKAILTGETDILQEEVIDDDMQGNYRNSMIERLEFTPISFECVSCELKLNGLMELQFASLEKPLDRSEFLEEFISEFYIIEDS
ncbi:hypothetical protein F4V43_18665 [Paenibacillus spiritus]|uniref:Uncharacterized protein n=1 Tax=Paenibacillus spiritus TaxID=2496557 RepID=A0A5J5FT75_9BACL|nr:hypothetical protein [Paenibacillus spiritus]KAA8996334.1 hypothetical protein F4V43_18665 [Paenibacillus spiritus]